MSGKPVTSAQKALCEFWHGIFGGKKYPIAFYTKQELAALSSEVRSQAKKYRAAGKIDAADALLRHFEYLDTFIRISNTSPLPASLSKNILPRFLRLLYSGTHPSKFWRSFLKKHSLPPRRSPYDFWDYFGNFNTGRPQARAWLKQHSHGRILDLGAGASSCLKVDVAADISPAALSKNCLANRKVKIRPLGTAPLPFKTGSFGTVMLNSVLPYVSRRSAVFLEIRRILAHSGRLLISQASLSPIHPANYFAKPGYSTTSVLAALRKAGFCAKAEKSDSTVFILAKKKRVGPGVRPAI